MRKKNLLIIGETNYGLLKFYDGNHCNEIFPITSLGEAKKILQLGQFNISQTIIYKLVPVKKVRVNAQTKNHKGR